LGTKVKVAEALLDDPALGRWIGARYRLVRVLGRGGMGAVYEAATADGGSFAVKIVRPDVPLRSDGLRRFARESRAAQQIENAHVARVVDAGTDDGLGLPFLVMERLEGRDLRQALRDVGPLAPSCAARLFVQACQGLAAAHACGVVHRDIKPANLFLQETGTGDIVLKLCDFGVAKHVALPEDSGDLTKSNGLLGSPMYMSPEQSRNPRTVDHRSDIFSLGVTLYETLTGRSPWQGVSALDLVVAMCTTDAPALAVLAPWVPPRLAAAVHKALARNPKDRFASADEFASALRPFVDGCETRYRLCGITTEQRRTIQVSAPPVAMTTAPGTEWTAERPRSRIRWFW
jgi:serine/threonine-protein kinase